MKDTPAALALTLAYGDVLTFRLSGLFLLAALAMVIWTLGRR